MAWGRMTFPALLGSVVVLAALAKIVSPMSVPSSLLALPVIAGGLVLNRRWQLAVVLASATVALLTLTALLGANDVRPANLFVIAATGGVSYVFVSSRERLGVTGLRGESMLAELRERLRLQGELPVLPAGWRAEVVQWSAGGVGFGGDFLVSSLTDGGRRLELVLVDVSGKGIDAGTRALLLSGAMGGLLGAVAPERFLPEANRYLRRQDWDEGFATAIHLAIDMLTGDYVVESAGHPPAAQFTAGSGKWSLLEAEGSVLGVFDDASWSVARGQMRRGDAMLLFTDGVIEVPGRDLDLGIDKLLGEANRLVISSFEGGAAKLVDAVARNAIDDRALVLVWRAG